MDIKCEQYKEEKATVKVTYGLFSEYKKGRPYYTHNLCDKAAKELYERCKGSINEMLMYWKNEKCA
jgi:hypothetical protein